MATTFIDLTGDGNNNKNFSFASYQVGDIKVEVDNVVKTVTTHYNVTNYTTTGGGTIVFTSGNIPAAGAAIRIYRNTDVDTAKATFQAGASIKASDLNDNQTQILYGRQEEQNQTVTTSRIKDGAVTNSKLAADSVAGANIQDDVINSQHYIAGSIDLEHMSANSVDSDQYVDGSIDEAHLANNAVTSAKIAANTITAADLAQDCVTSTNIEDDAVNSEHIAAGAVDLAHMSVNSIDSDQYVDGSIDHVHLANDSVDGDNIVDNAINTEHYADGSIEAVHLKETIINAGKLTADTIVTNAEQAAASVNDTSFFTTSASDARYFNISSGDTIKDGVTFPDNDTTIATTAAINDRIIDLVDDVGGFVPIANETSFPTANPDVNNGAGTLVSIKALASNLTSNGSGVATIANGAGSGNTVTINGLANSTTYAASFGMIVETTTTLHTYSFHRQVPKATEVTTVAGSISNVNTVAGSISNVNTAAGGIANINTTAGAISNVNTTAGAISNVNTVASNISNVNNFADLYQIDDFSPSAPTTDGGGNAVAEGDLAYDSTANRLKVYTGSAWEDGVAAPSDLLARSGGQMTGNITMSGSQTVDGRDLSADGTKLDGIEASADVTDATNVNAAGAVMNSDLATKGQILVGDGSGDPTALPVGTNTHILTADSSEATGVKWSAAPTGTPEGTAILSTGETGGTKFLREDGDNSCSWQTVTQADTTYAISCVDGDNSDEEKIRLTAGGSGSGTDDVVLEAGTGLSIARSGDKITFTNTVTDTTLTNEAVQDVVGAMVTGNTETGITVTYEDGDGTLDFVVGTLNQDTTGTAAIATTVTVADESSDTTCFPLFATAATGDLAPKSGSNLTFNSNTGALAATSFTGDGSALTGVSSSSADGCIWKNTLTISNNHTIASTEGAHSVGPITNNATVTVNGRWVIS